MYFGTEVDNIFSEVKLKKKNNSIMAKNSNLRSAKKSKNDEFYTLMEDIEKELRYYTESFEGKVVYCNCDDYQQSNFYKYFYYNFHYLKLKKLITTGYKSDDNGLYAIYDGEIETTGKLNGDGDFRSDECIEYLKQADVVVTNPPFSLFRQYVKQLMDYGKKFIVMANNNAITYKEFFPYIKNGKVWLGRTLFTGKMPYFKVSDAYNLTNDRFEKREDGLYKQVNGICWFTNVPNDNNRQVLDLYKRYSFEDYPKYQNYDAIECGRMENLPCDYDGVIGIPITGLKYLWSDGTIHTEYNGITIQFEIIKFRKGDDDKDLSVNGKAPYFRILIRKIRK